MDKRTTRVFRLQQFASGGIGRVLILGALTCAGAIEAHAVTQAIDQLQPGARRGVLQQTAGGVVRIDGVKYPLASDAVILTSRGKPLRPKLLEKMNGRQIKVQYWFATGAAKGEIVKIFISARK
jgi:hypothetical protein